MVANKKPNQTAMTIRFGRDLADRAKAVAEIEHRTLTATVIVAIEEHVARVEAAQAKAAAARDKIAAARAKAASRAAGENALDELTTLLSPRSTSRTPSASA